MLNFGTKQGYKYFSYAYHRVFALASKGSKNFVVYTTRVKALLTTKVLLLFNFFSNHYVCAPLPRGAGFRNLLRKTEGFTY